MRKHLYFYSSNLEYIKEFRDDDSFESVCQYPLEELKKCHKNEFGRIKTNQNYYHLLIGTIRNEGCPWCAAALEIDKINVTTFSDKYFLKCINCGARGPTAFINDLIFKDEEKWVLDRLKSIFEYRLPWDHNFVNPYEKT